MAGFPDDSKFVTADLPPEMRVGVGEADVAAPTAITDVDGMPAQLTRVSFPRPAHIPAGPPRISESPLSRNEIFDRTEASGDLRYDFPLFPGVQCRVIFEGEPTADHLDQLADYIAVACKRLREQEGRDARTSNVSTVANAPGATKLPRKKRTDNANQS